MSILTAMESIRYHLIWPIIVGHLDRFTPIKVFNLINIFWRQNDVTVNDAVAIRCLFRISAAEDIELL